MTIPGKGGRPRKWRSDADRQRAWRARQNGADEPATVVVALAEGDELARVWQIVRNLGERLDEANKEIADLRRERDQLRREHERDWRRYAWLESRVAIVEAERDRLEVDYGELGIELVKLREELAEVHDDATPIRGDATCANAIQPVLPRAQRRQLERLARRGTR